MADVPVTRPTGRIATLINRELSFFDYVARVLGVACDASLPLLERVRFCSICSQMQDEFFAARFGGLKQQSTGAATLRDGNFSLHAPSRVRARALDLRAEQAELWSNDLCPTLAAAGVVVADIPTLTATESAELERRYERDIYPMLTPLAVGPSQPFPYISGPSISLAAFVRDPDTGDERLARVKIPEEPPRFIALGDAGRYVPLERVLEHFLPTLFPGMEIVERALFRVTRDLDSDVSNDADDLLEAVEHELRRRRFGTVTRLEVSSGISQAMRDRLRAGLGITDELVYPVSGMLDLSDLSQLTSLDPPDLKADPWIPVARPPLGTGADHFAAIATSPLLVHHPYDSFASTYELFMASAAADPDFVALKSTVYRAGEDTPLAPTLIIGNGDGECALLAPKTRLARGG